MIVILLGPPGSGKGTQANAVKESLKISHISTGDILREAIKKDDPLGREAKQYMQSGKLVPDEIIIKITRKRISQEDCRNGFILDGFPRTVNQAEELDTILKEKDWKIDKVINLVIPDEILVERLSGRRTCSKCQANYHIKYNPPKKENTCDRCGGNLYQREDDKVETVKQRLLVYHRQTYPLFDYYGATAESRPNRGGATGSNRDKKVIININGEEEIEKISARILKELE